MAHPKCLLLPVWDLPGAAHCLGAHPKQSVSFWEENGMCSISSMAWIRMKLSPQPPSWEALWGHQRRDKFCSCKTRALHWCTGRALHIAEQHICVHLLMKSCVIFCTKRVKIVLALRSPLIQMTWQWEWNAIQTPLVATTLRFKIHCLPRGQTRGQLHSQILMVNRYLLFWWWFHSQI